MGLRDLDAPRAGLRPPGVRLRNKSNDIARLSLVVAAGATVEVDDDVAAQIGRQTAVFELVADEAVPAAVEPVEAEPVPAPKARRKG